ncbi:DUF5808 domain-containing protein [Paenibacillus solani]|uniref:DUF5808 domain-containing protein n=1 Tax=Paenibacillus solani TaxID=1705565 RepID=A0A0M1N3V5_9BACL|nr:DUF5808 domain-containing protein [Paenibacillus solani]KOR76659.1 hypothetical protein AM231_22185 [Paenibacillus solani]
MLTVILTINAIICYVALLATYKPQAKYKNGMLFSVTLPEHAMEHEGIRNIQTQFNKRMNQTSLGVLLTYIPFFVLRPWFAYQTIYFLLWLMVFMVMMVLPFRKAFRQTMALKREEDWFVGSKRMILGDLRVAQMKNQRSASPWLFLIPAVMSIALMRWAVSKDSQLWGLAVAGMAMTVLFFLILLAMRRTKAKVYSMDSEVNLVLNQAKRRAVSYLWLFMAILENVFFLLVFLSIMNENPSMNGVWLTITLLFTAIPVGLVIAVYHRIQSREREILESDGKTIYTDEDEYWASGITYHNPNDKSILVTKRVGIGETINTGTLVGKIIAWGTVALLAAVIFGTSFLMIRSELTSPELTVNTDHQVEIQYPMYSYSFDMVDIRQLSLVDSVPSGSKTNGESTNKYARGHFRLKDIGKSRLYLYKNNPPYIQFKLDDGYIFYNEEDPAKTKELYEELREMTGE